MPILTLMAMLTLSVIPALCQAMSAHEALTTGDQVLAKGDLAGALQVYGGIEFKQQEWPAKLKSLIRYHLENDKGSALEAWRLTQLARRTHRFVSGLDDYERLAIFRSGACPLATAGTDPARSALLNAATYRFHTTVMSLDSGEGEVGEVDQPGSSLVPGLTPFLAEIPRAELVAGQGCRMAKLRTRFSGKGVAEAELQELFGFLSTSTAHPVKDVAPLLIIARAFALIEHDGARSAGGLDAEHVKAELNSFLPPSVASSVAPNAALRMASLPWLQLPDAERRWFFVHQFKANRRADLPPEKRGQAQEIALSIIKSKTGAEITDWVAFVDLAGLPLRERGDLLARLEKSGSFDGRAWILFQLALTDYDQGHATEALTVVRRLLLEREENTEGALEEALIDLVARLFAEYRFDASVAGAVQAATPSRLWGQMLERAYLHAAFDGHAREFAALKEMYRKRGGIRYLREKEMALAEAMAKRNLSAFRSILNSFKSGAGNENQLLNFAAEFAAETADVEKRGVDSEVSEDQHLLAPFAEALATSLKQRLRPGDSRADEISDLVQVLSVKFDAWSRGATSVRRGIVKAGVARSKVQALPSPEFKLAVPELPLRDLIHIPVGISGDDWIISTAVR